MQFPAHGFGLDASRPLHILQLGLTHSSCIRMCTFTVAMPEVRSHSDDSHVHVHLVRLTPTMLPSPSCQYK